MGASRKVAFPKRGEIYYARFDPAVGAEIQKTRPALILQNNVANRVSPVTIVAAISSKIPERPHPVRVLITAKDGRSRGTSPKRGQVVIGEASSCYSSWIKPSEI